MDSARERVKDREGERGGIGRERYPIGFGFVERQPEEIVVREVV